MRAIAINDTPSTIIDELRDFSRNPYALNWPHTKDKKSVELTQSKSTTSDFHVNELNFLNIAPGYFEEFELDTSFSEDTDVLLKQAEEHASSNISNDQATKKSILIIMNEGASLTTWNILKVADIHSFNSSIELADESEANNHLNKLTELVTEKSYEETLDYLFDFVEDALSEDKLPMLDKLLSKSTPNNLKTNISISILRSTFRVRDKLIYWPAFLSKVKNHLKDDPKAQKRIRGLECYDRHVINARKNTLL